MIIADRRESCNLLAEAKHGMGSSKESLLELRVDMLLFCSVLSLDIAMTRAHLTFCKGAQEYAASRAQSGSCTGRCLGEGCHGSPHVTHVPLSKMRLRGGLRGLRFPAAWLGIRLPIWACSPLAQGMSNLATNVSSMFAQRKRSSATVCQSSPATAAICRSTSKCGLKR